MARTLDWTFPLPRTHTGVLLGNGLQGLMVWGTDRLCITVGRAGFWDRRFGKPFDTRATFRQVRTLLEADDEKGLQELFKAPRGQSYQIGCGRLEFAFPEGLHPVVGTLDLDTATLTITLANNNGQRATVRIRQAMDAELAWVELPGALRGKVTITNVPTWQYVGKELAKRDFAEPAVWHEGSRGGWHQTAPADPGLALAWADRGNVVTIATAYDNDERTRALALAEHADLATAGAHADEWWQAYWRSVPTLTLPDPVLQEAYDYGTYEQAGLTTPGAVAATLQGPWLEEYHLPPWGSDYHFNINVQMVYWPALASNRLEHFAPLWDMLKAWLPQLKENAERFFAAPGALMLPHSVDDRCHITGSFWAGTIDHGCTAWMAQLAWLHYRYAMDVSILRDIGWPLLVGAFNGYWAMLEEIDDGAGGQRLSLPVTVSPEYNGSGMNAWGRDASFQLAALHCVARILPDAAAILGQPTDPRWQQVRERLPRYTTLPPLKHTPPSSEEDRPGPRIALFAGKDLDASHRHPSHLAGIYPFGVIDPHGADQDVVHNSFRHWVRTGAGAWSGWALSFVALLHNRIGATESAVAWLHWWRQCFVNEGRGTLHDPLFAGVSTIGWYSPDVTTALDQAKHAEVMQMDAAMGVVTAVLDLMVYTRPDGVITLQPNLPRAWQTLSFDGIRTEGAFLVSGQVDDRHWTHVRVRSLAGARLKLAHQLGASWTLNGKPQTQPVLDIATRPGEELVLARA